MSHSRVIRLGTATHVSSLLVVAKILFDQSDGFLVMRVITVVVNVGWEVSRVSPKAHNTNLLLIFHSLFLARGVYAPLMRPSVR